MRELICSLSAPAGAAQRSTARNSLASPRGWPAVSAMPAAPITPLDRDDGELGMGTDDWTDLSTVSDPAASIAAGPSPTVNLLTVGMPPPPPAAMLVDDGAPPILSPAQMALYLVVLILGLCCMWSNFKPQLLGLAQCLLETLAICPPLRKPAKAALQRLGIPHSRHDPLDPSEIVWTNECVDPMRVDGSEEIDAELLGSDVEDYSNADDQSQVQDEEPTPRRGSKGRKEAEPRERRQRRSREESERIRRRMEEEDDDEVEEVEDDDDDEVEEVDDDEEEEDEEAHRGSRGREKAAARLGALEKKLRGGGMVTLDDLQGTRARVSAGGDFLPADLPAVDGPSASVGDDMTMVGLNTQVRNAQKDQSKMLRQQADRRQAKLEEALRQKQEVQRKKEAAKDEVKKKEGRRKMHKELVYMDAELDALTGASETAKGPPSQMLAAKWLLEHAYTKYPPQSFTKRRAAEEVIRARELRFRDAAMQALKLVQARYAPEKNSVAEFGAEWAVIAEEISKHAFSLCAGISRGAQQEAPPRSSGVFARQRSDDDDDLGFTLSSEMDHDDVEDAD